MFTGNRVSMTRRLKLQLVLYTKLSCSNIVSYLVSIVSYINQVSMTAGSNDGESHIDAVVMAIVVGFIQYGTCQAARQQNSR